MSSGFWTTSLLVALDTSILSTVYNYQDPSLFREEREEEKLI
jgi:hypothetical protein